MRIETDKIYCGDSLQVLQTLPENAVDCCVTSPPYYALRDYGADGQIGREATPEEYVARITAVFHEVKRVLTPEGTCWLNIADTYCGTGSKADHQDPKYPKGRNGQQVAFNHRAPGCKPKDLIGIPWLVALALRGDGWYLRSSIIWHKTNPMPESTRDRPTRCYEYVFLLTKSKKYYYDWQAVAEPIAPTTAGRLKSGVGKGNKYNVSIPCSARAVECVKKYTNFECDEFEGVEQAVTIVKDQLEVLAQMFHGFNNKDFFEGSPTEQLACLNRAVEYMQLSEELETRFMAAVKRMKQAFNLCSSSEKISDEEKDYIHFYCAVRSILFKLTKGDAPDISQMNARVREMLEGAIQSDGIEELFETGKHISVDIFSDEYMDKINAIQLPNTKIKILQRLLSQAIDEFKKVNKIMGVEFADRLKRVVDEYNNRRRDESYANEVLDDIAGKLADLLAELKTEKDSFKKLGIDYEEKAFYDILKAVAKKYEFDNEYPDEKMLELSKKIKVIVDDKSRYTDWSTRDDIKANLQVDLILLLDEYGYPPVTLDDVYKEVLEQAENFKKYAG